MSILFWVCPVRGHSNGKWAPGRYVQTVEWRRRIAYCLTPGCGRTSTDDPTTRDDHRMITDDGRRWWLLGADLWPNLSLYEAVNERAAIAAYRRDITLAERHNGRSARDTREWLRVAGLHLAAGPLTTVQAYEYELTDAYATELNKWKTDVIIVPVDGDYPYDGINLAEQIDPGKAAAVRREIRLHYLPEG